MATTELPPFPKGPPTSMPSKENPWGEYEQILEEARKKNLPSGTYVGAPGEYFIPDQFWEYEEKTKKRNPNKKKFTNNKYQSKFGEKRKTMSNKFLPFVVESSTPHNIFKTLISRSKGMSRALIASIFNLTLNVDIKELRKIANELDEMSLDQLYEELLQRYDIYRVNTESLNYFTNIIEYFPKERDEEGWWWCDKLTDFSAKDVMIFFCVYTLKDKTGGDYSEIDFGGLHNYEEILMDFGKFVKFSDDGVVAEFKDFYALKTFILYRALLHEQMEPKTEQLPICAKYIT